MKHHHGQRDYRWGKLSVWLGILATLAAWTTGCAQSGGPRTVQQPITVKLGAPAVGSGIQLVQHTSQLPEKETLPEPNMQHDERAVPINLDSVLRMAQDQNGEIKIAREKVNGAFAEKALADKSWIPDIYAGFSYYRHEGGIQDQDGRFIHSSFGSLFGGVEFLGRVDLKEAVYKKINAEREIWQKRGELSKFTSETLLDASNTYIDLLTAKTGEVISIQIEKQIRKVLNQTKKLAQTEKGMQVEVHRVQSQLYAQQQITRELKAGARKAEAKLVNLLGLNPASQLVVLDAKLLPIELIAPYTPVDGLISQALTNGPGVREIEGLLAVINNAQAQSSSLARLLPIFEFKMGEGGFGAGPGSSMTWDNRWDLGLHARWNLTNALTAKEQQWSAQSKINQAHLTYQNLQSKLVLGVKEAAESSNSSAEQFHLAEKQIKQAREAHKLSEFRLMNNIPGSSPSEVLMSIRALAGAQLAYVTAVQEYDKAQLRLLILTGGGNNCISH